MFVLGSFWRIQALGKSMVPKRLFLTKGVGKHKERLTSFEMALRDARLLLTVNSFAAALSILESV